MPRATWEWVTPAGDSLPLKVRDPVAGRGLPPVAIAAQEMAGQPGARVRSVRHAPRVVDLPVLLEADDRLAFRQLLTDHARALDPTQGAGLLRVTEPGQPAVELPCYYTGGLELQESDPEWQLVVLTFRAYDPPYWRDAAAVEQLFTEGSGLTTFFPLPPLTLAGGSVWAEPTVTNDGDVEAWPVWVVTGPGSELVLTNTTTGDVLTLARPIAAGEVITVDTRPGAKTVESSVDGDLYAELALGSALWPLARGANALQVSLGDAAPESTVALTYRRGYLAV